MIRKLFLCIIIFNLMVGVSAQKAILEKEVTDEIFNKEKGPNLKKFDHLYLLANFFINTTSDEVETKPFLSGKFGLGYRYKYKLLSFYNIGFDISYKRLNFNLKQSEDKVVPNDILHDKERLAMNNFDLELYQRFQIGKTGNMIGFFIDMGAYVGYVYGAKHVTKDEIEDDDLYKAELRKVINKKLNYTENLTYGVKARVGYNRFSLSGTYRFADLFISSYDFPELPRFTVGLQIGLH